MTRIIKIISILLLIPAFSVYGAEHDKTKSKELRTTGRDYPRMPGINGQTPRGVSIHYSNNHICFDLPAESVYLDVYIEDDSGMVWSGYVSSEEPCIDTPTMTFPSYIECTTDTGAKLSATLD